MDNCVRKTPKISIITVCYNSEKYLEETIQSVLRQNYQNVEYIIIDGGSTDNTVSIIDKYRQYITYFVSEPDNGISDAFNKGIRVATGDVIGIINSDDLLEEGALERVAQEYAPSVDWYRGDCKVWNDQTGFVFIEHPTLDWPAIPIKCGEPILLLLYLVMLIESMVPLELICVMLWIQICLFVFLDIEQL